MDPFAKAIANTEQPWELHLDSQSPPPGSSRTQSILPAEGWPQPCWVPAFNSIGLITPQNQIGTTVNKVFSGERIAKEVLSPLLLQLCSVHLKHHSELERCRWFINKLCLPVFHRWAHPQAHACTHIHHTHDETVTCTICSLKRLWSSGQAELPLRRSLPLAPKYPHSPAQADG